MRFYLTGIIFIVSLVPSLAFADVRITEIAWMGTTLSANDEWIELYNAGSGSVLLDGWTLTTTDGAPNIALSGTIDPGAYFLMERTDDSTVPSITADLIYSGSLGNTGETLLLKDVSGETEYQVTNSDGWTAGDNTTKETMQWSGSSWITASATPGAAATAPGSETGSDEGSENIQQQSSNESDSVTITKRKKPQEFRAELDIPKDTTIGNMVEMYGRVIRTDKEDQVEFRGVYFWNFGDGTWQRGKSETERDFSVQHVYKHQGTYIVVFEYFNNDFLAGEPLVRIEQKIQVRDGALTLSIENDAVVLQNPYDYAINIGGWQIIGETGNFIIPKDTIIAADQQLHFLHSRLDFLFSPRSMLHLASQEGIVVATYAPSTMTATPIYASTRPTTPSQPSLSVSIPEATPFSIIEKPEPVVIDKPTKGQGSVVVVFLGLLFLILISTGIIIAFYPEHFEKFFDRVMFRTTKSPIPPK